ncbi:MAG TPA: choice-of-anchor Q domain-containing protein [Solirubrobacteraceae bacterium]|nr:choice-of-anchor Q domain-containing protein [Solirubrobacteraceae bacterium]
MGGDALRNVVQAARARSSSALLLTIGTLVALVAVPATAVAAVTYEPTTFEDPPIGGESCTPPAPAGGCSLRHAIEDAKAGDTVKLAAGTYSVAFGELVVSNQIAIVGAGASATIVRQTSQSRVMRVENGLTMSGLTITGGRAVGTNGAAGASAGASGKPGTGTSGGGIEAGGAVTLVDVIVTGNAVYGGNGGNGANGSSGAGGEGGAGGYATGGGIDGGNPLTLTRVAITDNITQAGTAGNGGEGGTNGAGGKGGKGGDSDGGGLANGAGTVIASDALIADNQTIGTAGGAGGRGGTVTGTGGAGGQGEPGDGGGLFGNGIVRLTNVTLSGNSAAGGAGGVGGAARSPTASTNGGAGGLASGGGGGAASLFNGAAGNFASVTVAANRAIHSPAGTGGNGSDGGATGADGGAGTAWGGDLYLYNAKLSTRDTIVASGQADAGNENCTLAGGAVFTSLGHNLEDRHECIATPAVGDLQNAGADLGPLQDNGGPTQTMALLPGSAAIGAGGATCLDATEQPLGTDQRGLGRGTPCDVGAFDGQPPLAAAPALVGSGRLGTSLACLAAGFGGDQPQTTTLQWLRDGAPIAGAGGAAYTVQSADIGHAISCQQSVSNAFGSALAASTSRVAAAVPRAASAVLSRLKLSPKRVRRGRRETISFTLSAAARVTFSLSRRESGIKRGKSCLAPSRKHGHGKRCKRWAPLAKGAPRAWAGKAGANTVKWTPPHGLAPGASYRLVATPAHGRGVAVAFTIGR